MERTTVAVDLAKSVFEVAVANERGQITERSTTSCWGPRTGPIRSHGLSIRNPSSATTRM